MDNWKQVKLETIYKFSCIKEFEKFLIWLYRLKTPIGHIWIDNSILEVSIRNYYFQTI